MLFRETADVYCENHTKHTNTHYVVRMQGFTMLKRVVHIVTTGSYRVRSFFVIDRCSININMVAPKIEAFQICAEKGNEFLNNCFNDTD
jgi:hypothetical protein